MAPRFALVPLEPQQWAELQPLVRTARATGGAVIIALLETPWPDHGLKLQVHILTSKAEAKFLEQDGPATPAGVRFQDRDA